MKVDDSTFRAAGIRNSKRPKGVLFEFPYMSFGLRNAAQTFQRFMDEILKDLDFCFAHLDDIFVFRHSPQEHQYMWWLCRRIAQQHNTHITMFYFLLYFLLKLCTCLTDFN